MPFSHNARIYLETYDRDGWLPPEGLPVLLADRRLAECDHLVVSPPDPRDGRNFPTHVDDAIEPLVRAIWLDFTTTSSCCGHGVSLASVHIRVRPSDLKYFSWQVRALHPWNSTLVQLHDIQSFDAESPDHAIFMLKLWSVHGVIALSRSELTALSQQWLSNRELFPGQLPVSQ